MTHSVREGSRERVAAAALLLGTVFWGCGFTWAKAGGEAVQHAAELPAHSPFGPVFLLACRFLLGAILWLIAFPQARRGWTRRGLVGSLLVGLPLTSGLIVQHLGLDHTSEAVSAFLTSLTILFVPLLMIFVIRRPPRPALWAGVVLAVIGVWLMTGAQARSIGWGELLGLACALCFSLYILAVNAAAAHDSGFRITAAQFVIVAVLCFAACGFLDGGAPHLRPSAMAHILAQRTVMLNLVLLTIFPTVLAFGLLTFFQPRIDPTRAALIYLAEPIFATAYAAIAVGHRPGFRVICGAALILAANLVVEFLSPAKHPQPQERVVLLD